MNLLRKSLLIFLISGVALTGRSQAAKEPIKLSIAEAQSFALENNRNVRSAKIDVSIAEKKVWETIAIGLPQLGLAANYQHQFVVPKLSFGPYLDLNSLPAGPVIKDDLLNAYKPSPAVSLGVKDNATFDFTLSQLIFSGEYLVGLQATKVFKEISEKSLTKTESTTKESVAGTYHLVLVIDENIRLLNESLAIVDRTYNDLSKMNQQGLNEETDVDQVKISRSNLLTLISSLQSQKEVSTKLLKFQLGVDFDQSVILTDSLPAVIKAGNVEYLTSPQFNVENSIDYQMVSNMEKVSELSLKREKTKYLPTIAGFYRHHEQLNTPSFNFAVKDIVGATLSLPIFASGQRSAKISQAQFDLEKARLTKDAAEQGLIMEFETALSSYQTAHKNFITTLESMNLSKKVYDKTVIKFREGVASSFDLTQSQNQFLTAETSHYGSVLTLLNAKAKLDRILTVY
jgi:outer membrane protein